LSFVLNDPAAGFLHDGVPPMAELGKQRRFAAAPTSRDHDKSFTESGP
jgi:hypothetical protein